MKDLPDPAILDDEIGFEPLEMELPGWGKIALAAAGTFAVIVMTWSGALFG